MTEFINHVSLITFVAGLFLLFLSTQLSSSYDSGWFLLKGLTLVGGCVSICFSIAFKFITSLFN